MLDRAVPAIVNPASRTAKAGLFIARAFGIGLTETTVTRNNRYMSSRKQELLDAALAYLLEHGVANASLRPLAEALGTSPRMLIFHFKSKEGLLRDVFEALNSRKRPFTPTLLST